MTDTITTARDREQEPKSTYTVHVYREMRLRFDGIEAESPEQAAEKAREMHFDDAAEWSDCEGQSLSALVDTSGDENYEHSRVIDFEPGRMLDAAPKLLDFAAKIARMTQDGEQVDGREFVMENDDAVATLNDLIDEARRLVAAARAA